MGQAHLVNHSEAMGVACPVVAAVVPRVRLPRVQAPPALEDDKGAVLALGHRVPAEALVPGRVVVAQPHRQEVALGPQARARGAREGVHGF